MQPGTPGTWDGEKWIPLDHEQLRQMVVDILVRDVSPVLELPAVRAIVRDELATHMAAALADPDVGKLKGKAGIQRLVDAGFERRQLYALDEQLQSVAKALAGFLLERLTETKPET